MVIKGFLRDVCLSVGVAPTRQLRGGRGGGKRGGGKRIGEEREQGGKEKQR